MSFEDYKKRLKLFMIPNSNNSEICILIFQVNETNLCSISALINCIPSRAPVVVLTLDRSIQFPNINIIPLVERKDVSFI